VEFGLATAKAGQLTGRSLKGAASTLDDLLTSYVDDGLGVFDDVYRTLDDTLYGSANPQTTFYVSPDGTVMPATAYRYMDSKFANATIESLSSPKLSYFGFEEINSASAAGARYQVLMPDWSDMKLRGEFDTIQLFDEFGNVNAKVPMANGGRANFPEPFTTYYPVETHGAGGGVQLVPVIDAGVNFRRVELIGD
jgi:hypothetical protein